MAAVIRRKEEYSAASAADMNRHLDAAQWSAPEKLALACRILEAEEHGSALAGQPRPYTTALRAAAGRGHAPSTRRAPAFESEPSGSPAC